MSLGVQPEIMTTKNYWSFFFFNGLCIVLYDTSKLLYTPVKMPIKLLDRTLSFSI